MDNLNIILYERLSDDTSQQAYATLYHCTQPYIAASLYNCILSMGCDKIYIHMSDSKEMLSGENKEPSLAMLSLIGCVKEKICKLMLSDPYYYIGTVLY